MSSTDGLVAELLERGIAVLAYSGDRLAWSVCLHFGGVSCSLKREIFDSSPYFMTQAGGVLLTRSEFVKAPISSPVC